VTGVGLLSDANTSAASGTPPRGHCTRCSTDPGLEGPYGPGCPAIDGNCCSAVVLRRCPIFKQACPADPADCDPSQATGAGYAARFRLNGLPDSNLGNALLDGTAATGFVVFDPNQNRSQLVFDGSKGTSMGAMVNDYDKGQKAGDVNFKVVLAGQYARVFQYTSLADGSISERGIGNGRNCTTIPSEDCCEQSSLDDQFVREGRVIDYLLDMQSTRSLVQGVLTSFENDPHTANATLGHGSLSSAGLAHEGRESLGGGRLVMDVWSGRRGCKDVHDHIKRDDPAAGQAMYAGGSSIKVEPFSCQIIEASGWMAMPENPFTGSGSWSGSSDDFPAHAGHFRPPTQGPFCDTGYSSASLQVYDFVPYPPAVNTTWWGAGLVDWTVPVGCGFFGCTNTLENLCATAKTKGNFDCVICEGAHQEELKKAGCTEGEMKTWCSPPPSPPPPPAPSPPSPSQNNCMQQLQADCALKKKVSKVACTMCVASDTANLTKAGCEQSDQSAFCSENHTLTTTKGNFD
jgi:hypothetical protein